MPKRPRPWNFLDDKEPKFHRCDLGLNETNPNFLLGGVETMETQSLERTETQVEEPLQSCFESAQQPIPTQPVPGPSGRSSVVRVLNFDSLSDHEMDEEETNSSQTRSSSDSMINLAGAGGPEYLKWTTSTVCSKPEQGNTTPLKLGQRRPSPMPSPNELVKGFTYATRGIHGGPYTIADKLRMLQNATINRHLRLEDFTRMDRTAKKYSEDEQSRNNNNNSDDENLNLPMDL